MSFCAAHDQNDTLESLFHRLLSMLGRQHNPCGVHGSQGRELPCEKFKSSFNSYSNYIGDNNLNLSEGLCLLRKSAKKKIDSIFLPFSCELQVNNKNKRKGKGHREVAWPAR